MNKVNIGDNPNPECQDLREQFSCTPPLTLWIAGWTKIRVMALAIIWIPVAVFEFYALCL